MGRIEVKTKVSIKKDRYGDEIRMGRVRIRNKGEGEDKGQDEGEGRIMAKGKKAHK